jgi:hypothetical protein
VSGHLKTLTAPANAPQLSGEPVILQFHLVDIPGLRIVGGKRLLPGGKGGLLTVIACLSVCFRLDETAFFDRGRSGGKVDHRSKRQACDKFHAFPFWKDGRRIQTPGI